MNTISFETEQIEFDAGYAVEKYKAFFYVVDGKRLGLVNEWRPLSKYDVLAKPFWEDKYRTVLLAVCSCGEWECDSLVADVREEGGKIVWEIRSNIKNKSYFYRFDKQQYSSVIEQIEQAAKSEFKLGLYVHYENGDVDPFDFENQAEAVKYWNDHSGEGYMHVNFFEAFDGGECYRVKDNELYKIHKCEKYDTLQDIYSREEFRKISEIKNTKDFGYSPIVFSFPKESVEESCSESEKRHLLKRYVELETFWNRARYAVEEKFPDFACHSWRQGKGYFDELIFASDNYGDANLFFWEKLKEKAGDSWNDLKPYYMELNSSEVALLNCKDGINRCPDKVDFELFEACSFRNFEDVVKAVEKGANVNALDENGFSPMALVINSFREDFESLQNNVKNDSDETLQDKEDINYEKASAIIAIFDYLLACGADINLWGAGGKDCLYTAYAAGDSRIFRFLLAHGVRLDLNSSLANFEDDSWSINSNTYDEIQIDVNFDENDVESEKRPRKIMDNYGAVYWYEGWNKERLENYYSELKHHLLKGESCLDDEEIIDEYACRYDENEDQSDAPGDPALDEYFAENPADLRYYTFFRRYSDWPKQLNEYAHIFKDRYGVFPNVVLMNRITEGRLEDAFNEVIAKDMDWEEKQKLAVKLGVERGDTLLESEELGLDEFEISSDAYFSTDEYRLLCLECTVFGSGVIELIRTHGFLSDDPCYDDGCRVSVRDKENTAFPVIDMAATGKNLKEIMAEEEVTPKLISRITGHSLQAIYDWLAGKKMPNLDNLMLLARVLNRPVEQLIVTHNREE